MKSSSLPLTCVIVLAGVAILANTVRHRQSYRQSSSDYYLLALSWGPNYCASHPGDNSGECRSGKHTGFILHGLWPEAESGASPVSCAPAHPVAHALVDHMLLYMPSRGLIQHEWAEHGTCSGLSPQDYFGQAEQAFKRVQIPEQYRSFPRAQEFRVSELKQAFAKTNHTAPAAFRISCHGSELVNVEACLTKDLQFRDCGSGTRECSADRVKMHAQE